jgi:hypothetical protein
MRVWIKSAGYSDCLEDEPKPSWFSFLTFQVLLSIILERRGGLVFVFQRFLEEN